MTFLDSSVIIDMLEGHEETVEFVEDRPGPYLTSSLCVYEVLEGSMGSGRTDVAAERQRFDGIRAVDLSETVAIEAAKLQDELLDDGQRMSVRDVLIAATARSASDHLIVADSDFQVDALESKLDVTNLRQRR